MGCIADVPPCFLLNAGCLSAVSIRMVITWKGAVNESEMVLVEAASQRGGRWPPRQGGTQFIPGTEKKSLPPLESGQLRIKL